MSSVCFARSMVAAALVVSAGIAAPAVAQCHLSVDAMPLVVRTGETARVQVRAHFPATDYAWASAQFTMTATEPEWMFASAGALAWTDVLGINLWQNHQPHLGVLADPSNPKRIWTGIFVPNSPAPALVTIEAVPSGFSVYPSPLTSSSAPCNATGGQDQILVNPLTIGAAAAAPALGSTLETVGDSFVAESPQQQAILIGLLLPAVQKVREAAARVAFDEAPTSLRIEATLPSHAGDHYPTEQLSLSFGRVRATSLYEVETQFPLGIRLEYQFSIGGVPIAKRPSVAGPAPFRLEGLPDVLEQRWEPLRPAVGMRPARGSLETFGLVYDAPVRVFLDGGQVLLADRVEVRMSCQNNLKQIGLASHNYHAQGASVMKVTPRLE